MKTNSLNFIHKISLALLSCIIFSLSGLCFADDYYLSDKDNELALQLLQAVAAGDIEEVRYLIEEEHVSLKIKFEKGHYTPLMIALINNHKEIFDLLIELDTNIKNTLYAVENQGYNIVFMAIAYNRAYMFDRLIELDPNLLKSKTRNDESLLHIAATYKNVHFLEKILSMKMTDIHQKTKSNKENFLHYLYSNLDDEHPKRVQLKDLFKKDDPVLDEESKKLYKTYEGIFFPQALYAILSSKNISKEDKAQLINDKNQDDQRSILHYLTAVNDLKSIDLMLQEEGVLIDQKDYSGLTPLAIAVIYGNEKISKLFLDYGADILHVDDEKREVYRYAFNHPKPNIPLLKLITSHLSQKDREKHLDDFIVQGINESIVKSKTETLQYFIELINSDKKLKDQDYLNTIKFSIRDESGLTYASVIDLATRFSKKEEIFELLLKNGVEIKFDEMTGSHPFHRVIKKNDLKLVKLFYQYMKPSDINLQIDDLKISFLFTALRTGNYEISEFLLEKGANPNVMVDAILDQKDTIRFNLFTVAVIADLDLKFFKILMKHGINPITPDSIGFNALFWMIKKKRLDVFQYLTENLSEKDLHSLVNHSNHKKEFPLFLSIASDQLIEFTRLMVKHGADTNPFKEDPDRPSALEQAIINGSEKNAQFLLDHTKQDLNEIKTNGKRPFEYVIIYSLKQNKENASRMIDWLLKNGADPNLKSKEGLNMLHLSIGLGLDIDIVSQIIKKIKNINDVIDKNQYNVGHIIGAREADLDLDKSYLKLLVGLNFNIYQKNTVGESTIYMLKKNKPELFNVVKDMLNFEQKRAQQQARRNRTQSLTRSPIKGKK